MYQPRATRNKSNTRNTRNTSITRNTLNPLKVKGTIPADSLSIDEDISNIRRSFSNATYSVNKPVIYSTYSYIS